MARVASKRKASSPVAVLVATRKGAWLFHGDSARRAWRADGPHFLGHIVSHVVLDPRDGRTLLAAAKTGHLGPTVFRSTDRGRTWKEAARPPAFAKATDGAGRAVDHTFWLTPGHANEPGVWYAGTSPQGLFRSEDGGGSWEPFSTINDDPQYREWMGTVAGRHARRTEAALDHRRPARSEAPLLRDVGRRRPRIARRWRSVAARSSKGMEVVEGIDPATITFHDPHCVRMCPTNPDRLYQQNHCGIYRLDRPGDTWVRIGRAMPKAIGDIGFPMVVHPRDADTAWVFPMDGTAVWPRTSPGGKPAVYVTRNAGRSWQAARRRHAPQARPGGR